MALEEYGSTIIGIQANSPTMSSMAQELSRSPSTIKRKCIKQSINWGPKNEEPDLDYLQLRASLIK